VSLWVAPAGRAAMFGAAPERVMTFASRAADARAGPPGAPRLDLTFNDIDAPRDGFSPPNAGHIAAILEFAAAWDRSGALLICCYAGISRSTAAAYIVACARAGAGAEASLAQELRRLSPSATPNPRMVALADDALGRGGRMRAAVAAIGRGADAFEGAPFRWTLGA
jgi:predicted protein tyrosine phosphatase